jgi:Xaa-Pro aminopeptidase
MPEFDLDENACRQRQRHVIDWMASHDVDLFITTQIVHVQYLIGPRFRDVFAPAAAINADGHAVLVAPRREPPVAAADEVVVYKSNWLSTLRNDQRQASSQALLAWLNGRAKPRRVACEFSSFPPHLSTALDAELIDIEPELYRLRRQKDPDELALLRKAIAGTAAMHRRAREIVAPGINELDVYNQLQAVANREYGEVMTGTGNDYASAARGGPPRDREIQSGELYILDLGPAYRGYFADNTRTIAVGGNSTDRQLEAWRHCTRVFELVEQTVKPGKRCRELFDEAQAALDEAPIGKFDHHLGHGIGLFPHEAPHLNPNWDDVFQVGEVFAVEPGLYAPELNVGLRLENNYLVTDDGVELLTDFPLDL